MTITTFRAPNLEKEITLYLDSKKEVRITAERYKISKQVCSYYRIYEKEVLICGTNILENVMKHLIETRKELNRPAATDEKVEQQKHKKKDHIEKVQIGEKI